MIVIIDYKAGNIGSIKNMIKKIGHEAMISDDSTVVAKASKIILPGVGSFDYGMAKLKEIGLVEILGQKVMQENVPILGICLGAQLMCNGSEEGASSGLKWISGEVKKFDSKNNEKKFTVPHMGWDTVNLRKESKLFLDVPLPARFYFVHSYYIKCDVPEEVLTDNIYSTSYHSAFERGNILGVQFHPEKSHKFGKQLLKNFIYNY